VSAAAEGKGQYPQSADLRPCPPTGDRADRDGTDHVRVPLKVEHADRVEPDVEELVDRLERARDAEVVLELDRDLCEGQKEGMLSALESTVG
jgi:hypothetical protein